MLDPLQLKPFPQRRYLEADQGAPFVGADGDMWRRYRAFYNGLVESVDREIGSVLDALPGGRIPPSLCSGRTTAISGARMASIQGPGHV